MGIIEYLLLWFGMITTGFMAGMGNQFAQDLYKKHIKKIKIKEMVLKK